MHLTSPNRPTPKQQAVIRLAESWRARTPLSHRGFAEKYVRLHTGPYKGLPFKCSRQPFTGLLFDEIDSGDWPFIFITGPSQSSKTLSGFCIPTLYPAVELNEDVLVGVPEADMADDKFQKDILPTLRESPSLRHLIPNKGPGSKGGTVKDRVTLGNGVSLKIMTRGGQDTAKAGFTARCIRVTEAAGWSHASDASPEADHLRQLKARMRAFGRRQRSLIVEGTTTIETELPWRQLGDADVLISTRSKILTPCPHCPAWISPEREQLIGWQEAQSEDEAENNASFFCPECGELIAEEERKAVNQDCRLVHHGQSVNSRGEVVGEKPPTSTLWFRWSQYHNMLLTAGDSGVEEWTASQIEEGTIDRENAEKELCQFNWCVPYVPPDLNDTTLNAKKIRKRKTEWPRSVLPPDVVRVGLGMDVGKWTSWWALLAERASGQICVVDYGAIDVVTSAADDVELRLRAAIADFHESQLEPGWSIADSGERSGYTCSWIDCGWLTDTVCESVDDISGKRGSLRAVIGRGRSQIEKTKYAAPGKKTNETRELGKHWHSKASLYASHDSPRKKRIMQTTFDADYYKKRVHECVNTATEKPGGMSFFYSPTANEHAKISNHIANEQFVRELVEGKGVVEKWVKNGQNHLLDCLAMAMGALDMAKHFDRKVVRKGYFARDGDGDAV